MTFRSQIPILSVATCNACQNVCEWCAHQGIRDGDMSYQMPLDDLDALIEHFKKIECQAVLASFCGPGEPLLWRHFNEGARRLVASGIAGRVEVTTNGRLLSVIADDVWPLLNPVYVSRYEHAIDMDLIAKHSNVVIREKDVFMYIDESKLPSIAVGQCVCPGATYYKRRIYPHCGPVFGDAIQRSGFPVTECSVELDEYNPQNLPAMTLPCRWCWGNSAIPKTMTRHRTLNHE